MAKALSLPSGSPASSCIAMFYEPRGIEIAAARDGFIQAALKAAERRGPRKATAGGSRSIAAQSRPRQRYSMPPTSTSRRRRNAKHMAAVTLDFGKAPANDTVAVEQEFADELAFAGCDHLPGHPR